jgi:Uma2 family endonuclease
MTMGAAIGLTIEEFEALPDALAHNHELVEGELVDVSGNVGGHNQVRDYFTAVLLFYVLQHKLGDVVSEQEFEFEENAHGPDISFLGVEKAKRFDKERRVQLFVPDLTIEIASQGERFEKLLGKILRYRRCGVKEAYIFSITARQAFIYSDRPTVVLSESDEFRSDLIPGFSIRLKDLFDRI